MQEPIVDDKRSLLYTINEERMDKSYYFIYLIVLYHHFAVLFHDCAVVFKCCMEAYVCLIDFDFP